MKKFIHVIDESLEEILMVLMLAAMTLIMSGIFQIYSWSIAFVVRGDHKISVYMVCIFKCESLYQKMHFYQGGSVYQNVPKTWKNYF